MPHSPFKQVVVKSKKFNQGRKPFKIPDNKNINWERFNHEIAEELGTTVMTVIQLRKRLGIPPMPRGRPSTKNVK